MIGYLILIIVLVIFSAFFSAAEIAIFSTTQVKLREMLEKNIAGAKTLEYLKSNPKKTLVTILIGNNIVNITASSIATMLAIRNFGSIGAGIATGAMVLIVLVFGEVTPKSYAVHNASTIAVMVAPILAFLMKALYPIIILFEYIARKITKTEIGMKSPQVTQEELKAILEMSMASGNVKKEEKEMIESVLRFSDITLLEVMTHRNEIISLDATMTLKDAAKIVEEYQFSRYPIFKKSKENIIGVAHIKDLFFALNKGQDNTPVNAIMSNVEFVPQHMTLNDLFKEFHDKQIHLAVVVNDHGELIGIATLEDLLEELVGEIIDESDVKQHMIKRIDKQTVMAHGTTELKALNRFFHSTLPGSLNDTLSKIILKKLKRFPDEGETFVINQNEITIVESTKKNIIKIKIKKLYE